MRFNYFFIFYISSNIFIFTFTFFNQINMKELKTWSGIPFKYSGSITSKIDIRYGNNRPAKLTELHCEMLRMFINPLKGNEIFINSSRDKDFEGGLGQWLKANVTKTAIASYISSILVNEGYASYSTFYPADKVGKIKFN